MQHTHKTVLILILGLGVLSIPCFAQVQTSKLAEEAYIQRLEDFSLKDNYKSIMLGDVIEQGLRMNHDQLIRNKQGILLDLSWDDSYYAFWYPQLKLSLSTNRFSVSEIFNNDRTSTDTSKMPSGTFGLSLEDYTLFNWGKDFLTYLNARQTYKRGKESLQENRRELKHDLIEKFFENISYKNIEEAYKGKLRHASFIYRLNREKVAVGNTTKEQFLQARSNYLKAQTEYQSAKIEAQVLDEELAYLISDPVGTRYVFREFLKYEPLRLKHQESLGIVNRTNPDILDSLSEVENTRRSYELQRRENLPLPKFALTLGAYNHTFGPTSAATKYLNSYNGTSQPEIVGSISASWSIFGEGGFFNGRKTETALVNQHIALKKLSQSKHKAVSDTRTLYRRILIHQKKIEILQPRLKTLQKTFDTILENYINRKTRFIAFSHALEELTDTEVEYIKAKLDHLKAKIDLAQVLGLGDFPGESFEKLAVLNSQEGENE